ncbi:carbohydrate-binding module family 20 domain-containing protein [Corallococcus sicarius]|uniref:Alpha-amylase n=1 Tax=Corallococcus sicarius TaxID=2316726 RepID=A0A3A8NW68_9BACT|nr:carbohydrate-binding module family 20 domain-containing protein [Corallococcus sicarius]RKH47400.1 alpha-amylase [Corallococcus sicarius]
MTMKTRLLAASMASLFAAAPAAAKPLDGASTDVMIQGFHWNSASAGGWWNTVKNNAATLKDAGFTMVWLPPPSDAASIQGYLPRQLNVLNSSYGTEAELTAALAALNAQGVKPIADIVVNHRVGTANWADFTNPTWGGCNAVAKGDEWATACGNPDSGEAYGAARDLDHTQTFVRNDLKTWMNSRLKGVGFAGWRFDFVKGFAGGYVKEYVEGTAPWFCVGEHWPTNYFDANNPDNWSQQIGNWVTANGGTCAAFDFSTKGLLNDALTNNNYSRLKAISGKPAGFIGHYPKGSVTFVDNHDTGPSETCGNAQNHWPVPCAKVMQGYAYILSHPGIPTVYWPHYFNWGLGNSIKALMTIRKNAGLTSESTVNILRAEAGLYAAIIDNKVAVKIGTTSWSPGAGWTQAASGTDYTVWTSGGTTPPPTTANVEFVCNNGTTVMGQNVYVTGSITELSNWSATGTNKILNPTAYPTWRGTYAMPANTSIQWKCVKRDGAGNVVWQGGGNNVVTTPAAGASITTTASF